MKKIFKNIEIHWGFPVEAEKPGDSGGEVKKTSRGIALLMAIMVIATMLIFTTDMIVTSSVNLQLAATNRDRIKAEYLAKSGVNMAIFLLSADLGIDMVQYQMQKIPPSDGSSDIWTMMNGLPIGGDSLEMVSQTAKEFDLNKVNDKSVLDGLKQFDGEFALTIEDETRKINLNFCAEGQARECLQMLEALMSCPAEKEYLTKKKLTPKELAANIKDWVDVNTSAEPGANQPSEEAPYEKREPKMRPKNAPMDSLAELKQVAGWDDDLQKIFSPFLTIFPVPLVGKQEKPKVNLNTANRALLSCLMPQIASTCAEKSVKITNPAKAEDEPLDVASPADINKRLSESFCETDKKKSKWFTYRSDVFRIQSSGTVGEQVVTIDAVLKRGLPDNIEEKDGFTASYKFLSWKML